MTEIWINQPPSVVLVGREQELRERAPRWLDLAQEEKERIRAVRYNDLMTLRLFSLVSLLPLGLVSFIAGYIIAGQLLRPIKDINVAVKSISSKNLAFSVDRPDVDDEFAELIDNFGSMVERLESSFLLQRQFIASASHELKTPLAVILSNYELLDHPKLSQAKRREATDRIMRSIERMKHLIDDLLLLSEHSLELQKKPIIVYEMLHSVVESLQDFAAAKQVKLVLPLGGQKLKVSADAFYLERAIHNVVENAIKYTHPNTDVEISLAAAGGQVLITVIDNGPGMDAEHLMHIFERFYSGRSSRSIAGGGTGLGMAISKKVIDDHSGSIQVDSQIDAGTQVEIRLPLLR